jgi:hypothetical protein
VGDWDFTAKRSLEGEIVRFARADLSITLDDFAAKIEAGEKRKDARLAREFVLALPAEATPEQRQQIAVHYADWLSSEYGCAVHVALHKPDGWRRNEHRSADAIKNYHAHLTATDREWVGAQKKIRKWNKPGWVDGPAHRKYEEISQQVMGAALPALGTRMRRSMTAIKAEMRQMKHEDEIAKGERSGPVDYVEWASEQPWSRPKPMREPRKPRRTRPYRRKKKTPQKSFDRRPTPVDAGEILVAIDRYIEGQRIAALSQQVAEAAAAERAEIAECAEAEAERKRIEAAEAERKRVEAEAERRRIEAAEAERKRVEAEAERRRIEALKRKEQNDYEQRKREILAESDRAADAANQEIDGGIGSRAGGARSRRGGVRRAIAAAAVVAGSAFRRVAQSRVGIERELPSPEVGYHCDREFERALGQRRRGEVPHQWRGRAGVSDDGKRSAGSTPEGKETNPPAGQGLIGRIWKAVAAVVKPRPDPRKEWAEMQARQAEEAARRKAERAAKKRAAEQSAEDAAAKRTAAASRREVEIALRRAERAALMADLEAEYDLQPPGVPVDPVEPPAKPSKTKRVSELQKTYTADDNVGGNNQDQEESKGSGWKV